MFCLRKPTEQDMRNYLLERQDKPFSYEPVNGSMAHKNKEEFEADPAFQGYDIAQMRVTLGKGEECFRKAVAAVKAWKTFDVNWAILCYDNVPVEVGSTIGIMVYQLGIWVVSFCRISSVVDEWDEGGQVSRFAFSSGTLNEHVVHGEERFVVEWSHETNDVTYEILSFSSPHHWLTQVGYPVARYIQDKFAVASGQAMQKAVGTSNVTQI